MLLQKSGAVSVLSLGLAALLSPAGAAAQEGEDPRQQCLQLALPEGEGPGPSGKPADQTIETARKAARENRNKESRQLFEQAIKDDPGKCPELLAELADQLTYSDQSARAVPIYRHLLPKARGKPEEEKKLLSNLALALSWSDQKKESLQAYQTLLDRDPKDVNARLGKARVLSWLDKPDLALDEYRMVLAQDPDNQEAQRGVGRVLGWKGQHQAAQAHLLDFQAKNPKDNEAGVLLAQNQYWLGRPDKARATLAPVLERDPGNKDGLKLRGELDRSLRPATRLFYQASQQSDYLDIRVWTLEHDVALNDGRTVVGPRYQFYEYSPRGGGDIDVNRFGLYGRHILSDQTSLTGEIYLDRQRGRGISHDIPTANTYLTYRPSDRIRMDIGYNRSTFDNINSLSQGLYANYGSYSIDFLPNHLNRFTLRANRGWYSDSNRRDWGQLEYERKLFNKPNWFAGLRYTNFRFEKQLNNGYFNPERYESAALTSRLNGQWSERLYYDLDASYGREIADPGGGKPIWSGGVRVAYRLTDRVELEARLQRFQSSTASTSGFSRTTAAIGLRYVW